jgi:hypothetical protein
MANAIKRKTASKSILFLEKSFGQSDFFLEFFRRLWSNVFAMRKTIQNYITAVDSLESALELGMSQEIIEARDKVRKVGQEMEIDIARTEGDEIFGQVDFYSLLQVAGYEELTERANQMLREIASAQPY